MVFQMYPNADINRGGNWTGGWVDGLSGFFYTNPSTYSRLKSIIGDVLFI